MKSIACILCLLLFAAQDILVERATEDEVRQVHEVANAFEKRMRDTRDLALLNDLFINDFVRLQMDQERTSNPGAWVVLVPSIPLSMKAELASEVTQQDWQRFHTANFNLNYYTVLIFVSRFEPGELLKGIDENGQKLYPAEAFKLLRADPILRGHYGAKVGKPRYTIDTVDELKSLIDTVEQVTLIVRRNMVNNPPEQTPIYKRHLQETLSQNPARTSPTRPDVYGTRESRLSFPVGTRFFHTITADSLFELWLVKTDRGVKITWARVYPFN